MGRELINPKKVQDMVWSEKHNSYVTEEEANSTSKIRIKEFKEKPRVRVPAKKSTK